MVIGKTLYERNFECASQIDGGDSAVDMPLRYESGWSRGRDQRHQSSGLGYEALDVGRVAVSYQRKG